MTKQLVFLHGRAQENKDAKALKDERVSAFSEGLAESGLALPIAEDAIRFPYYDQALYDLVDLSEGRFVEQVAEVIVRGRGGSAELEFVRSVLEEVRTKARITDDQLADATGEDTVERRVSDWGWVRSILKALDTHVPIASGGSIALATYDVYQYLKNRGILGIQLNRKLHSDSKIRSRAEFQDQLGANSIPDFWRNRAGYKHRSFCFLEPIPSGAAEPRARSCERKPTG